MKVWVIYVGESVKEKEDGSYFEMSLQSTGGRLTPKQIKVKLKLNKREETLNTLSLLCQQPEVGFGAPFSSLIVYFGWLAGTSTLFQIWSHDKENLFGSCNTLASVSTKDKANDAEKKGENSSWKTVISNSLYFHNLFEKVSRQMWLLLDRYDETSQSSNVLPPCLAYLVYNPSYLAAASVKSEFSIQQWYLSWISIDFQCTPPACRMSNLQFHPYYR